MSAKIDEHQYQSTLDEILKSCNSQKQYVYDIKLNRPNTKSEKNWGK